MKILHATSELYPLIKTGGLADVLGALPFAQQKRGDDVRVVMPYYRQVREAFPETVEIASRDTFGGYVTVRFATFNEVVLVATIERVGTFIAVQTIFAGAANQHVIATIADE